MGRAAHFANLETNQLLVILVLLLQLLEQLSRGLLSVTLGVVLSPAPQILAGLLKRQLSLPTQLSVGASGVRSQVKDIASTARSNLVRKVTANSGGECADHLVDSAASAGTQVPSANTGVVRAQVVQGLQVTVCQVEDVDVVADGGTIVGSVVCALSAWIR